MDRRSGRRYVSAGAAAERPRGAPIVAVVPPERSVVCRPFETGRRESFQSRSEQRHAACSRGAPRRSPASFLDHGLRPEPAGGSRRATAPDGLRRPSGQAQHRRLRRICRPLRRRRFGRGARARVGLSRPGAFHRRPDGQAGRSPVHHRPASVPDDPRAGQGQPRPGARQSGFRGKRPRPRGAARAREDHHGADLRPAHPGQEGRRGLRRRPGGGGEAGEPRSGIHRAAGAGRRPHR